MQACCKYCTGKRSCDEDDQSVQIAGNTIVVQTDVTNLQVVSRFLSALQNDSRNGFVTVTTASASKDTDTTNNDVTATVVITYGGGGN